MGGSIVIQAGSMRLGLRGWVPTRKYTPPLESQAHTCWFPHAKLVSFAVPGDKETHTHELLL